MSTKYAPIPDDEYGPEIARARTKSSNVNFLLISLSAFFLALAATALGYVLGQTQLHNVCSSTDPILGNHPIRTTTRSFSYNSTYAEAPSPETDAAWETVFPPHGGFFHDSDIAPNGGSLAVYHQLHCVDAIRKAYYTLLDAVMQGNKVDFSELDDFATDWHTRHCIDFLRQMLMCNADLTVEEVDPSLGGITGFGRQHQCVVWEDVLNWSVAHQSEEDATSE